MWCSFCIDLFPHYSSEYFFTNSVSFLAIVLLLKFFDKGYPDWRKFDLGLLKR